MIKLSQYLNEAAAEKDRHLTHIEDAVLEGGVTGTRNAIQFLISDRKSTRLNSSHTDISRMPSSA